MPAPSIRRIWERGQELSPDASWYSIRTRPGKSCDCNGAERAAAPTWLLVSQMCVLLQGKSEERGRGGNVARLHLSVDKLLVCMPVEDQCVAIGVQHDFEYAVR